MPNIRAYVISHLKGTHNNNGSNNWILFLEYFNPFKNFDYTVRK